MLGLNESFPRSIEFARFPARSKDGFMPTSKVPGDEAPRGPKGPRSEGRRFLTPEDVEKIVKLIRSWPALPMTWEHVRERVTREIQMVGPTGKAGKRYGSNAKGWSRQALAGHGAIKESYESRSRELAAEGRREQRNPARNRDPETVLLRRQCEALRIEIETLRRKVAEYEETFAMLVYNRHLGDVSPEDITRLIPKKADRRGRT